MSKEDKTERTTIEVPHKIGQEINTRAVRALRVNVKHAKGLCEDGEEYAMSNNVDVALRAWMLWQITQKHVNVRDSIECVMNLIVDSILPNFVARSPIKEMVIAEMSMAKKESKGVEQDILEQVNEMLTEAGLHPIICGGTLDEIIEQLSGLRDSEGETKQ